MVDDFALTTRLLPHGYPTIFFTTVIPATTPDAGLSLMLIEPSSKASMHGPVRLRSPSSSFYFPARSHQAPRQGRADAGNLPAHSDNGPVLQWILFRGSAMPDWITAENAKTFAGPLTTMFASCVAVYFAYAQVQVAKIQTYITNYNMKMYVLERQYAI